MQWSEKPSKQTALTCPKIGTKIYMGKCKNLFVLSFSGYCLLRVPLVLQAEPHVVRCGQIEVQDLRGREEVRAQDKVGRGRRGHAGGSGWPSRRPRNGIQGSNRPHSSRRFDGKKNCNFILFSPLKLQTRAPFYR